LADIIVNFWNLTWGKETPAIDQKTKLLLSLANGVGAGWFRQATRELVKAYALGVTVAELDELFSLFVWNGGGWHLCFRVFVISCFRDKKIFHKMQRIYN